MMHARSLRSVALVAALAPLAPLVLLAGSAPLAAQVVYHDRASFDAATTRDSTITFDNVDPKYVGGPGPRGHTPLFGQFGNIMFFPAFEFTGTASFSYVLAKPTHLVPLYDWDARYVYTFTHGGQNAMELSPRDGPIHGFGFDFGVEPDPFSHAYNPNFTVQLMHGTVLKNGACLCSAGPPIAGAYVGSPSTLQFFGVTDTEPFDGVLLEWDTESPLFLDFVTAPALAVTATPEPASIALLGTGLLALGGVASGVRRADGRRHPGREPRDRGA